MEKPSNQKRDLTMNEFSAHDPNSTLPVWWEEWQLLVDGELESTRRAELLRRIDQTANGWRQCALALLDEWYLKREMQQLVAESCLPCEPQRQVTLNRHAQRPWNVVKTAVAAACLALLAFTAGYTLSRWYSNKPTEWVRHRPANHSVSSSADRTPDRSMATASRNEDSPSNGAQNPTDTPLVWVDVPLPADEGQAATWIRVPIQYAVTYTDDQSTEVVGERWDRFVKRIATVGGQIHRRRYWYGYELSQTSQLWVPVEDWQLDLPDNVHWQSLFEEVQP